jgi:1-phosphofructokinase
VIVTVTPNASLDLTYRLLAGSGERWGLATDRVHRAQTMTLEASGKGVNVTRILARAGYPSIAVLAAGGTTGDELLRLLTDECVEYRHSHQAGPTRINTTILGDATVTKINGPGSAPSPAEVDDLVQTVARTLEEESKRNGHGTEMWLAVCGSFPPQTDIGLMARLVMTARVAGIRCAVDSSGPALASAISAGAHLLAPNLDELAQVRPALRAVMYDGEEAVRQQISAIAAADGCQLLISLGVDGAIWTNGHRTVHARAEPVIAINTAGAGDALLAGWLSGTDEQDPLVRLQKAVSWGTAACLSATTVAGPAP